MKTQIIFALLIASATITSVLAEPMQGKTGSAAGDEWQSSWLDIKPSISFKKGEILKIKVDGRILTLSLE